MHGVLGEVFPVCLTEEEIQIKPEKTPRVFKSHTSGMDVMGIYLKNPNGQRRQDEVNTTLH